MIQIERVNHVPQPLLLQLRPYSLREVELGLGKDLSPRIDLWYVVDDERPLALIGVERAAFVGAANVRFLFGRDYGTKHLRGTRIFVKRLVELYGVLHAHVEDGFLHGRRFAEFAGFRRTTTSCQMHGHTYTLYEAR